MKNLFLLGFLFLTLNSTGCSYAMEEIGLFKNSDIEVTPFGKSDDLPPETKAKVIDFDLLRSTSLKSCLTCHSEGSSMRARPIIDTAEKVLKFQDDITHAINHTPGYQAMPPKSSGFPQLAACEKKILATWIENKNKQIAEDVTVGDLAECAGEKPTEEPIKEEPPVEEEVIPLKDLEATFENLKLRILEPKCLMCHVEGKAKRTILDSVEKIKEHGLLSATGDESILYQIVVPGRYDFIMPPKRIGPPLSEEETEFIKRWIDSREKPTEEFTEKVTVE